jgi:lipoyl(octanoyl) transferase
MKKRIALIDSDRGGQITYHGPGQLVFYPLLDLRRLGLGVRDFVTLIEETVIDFLCQHEILGNVKEGAPGVYVFGAKVAAIGIRVQKGCTYHGFSVNVDMDLTPFGSIDPCGYADLRITQLKDVGISGGIDQVWRQLIERLTKRLCYKDVRYSAIRNANLGNPSIHL